MKLKKRYIGLIALVVGVGCIWLLSAGRRALLRAWTWGDAQPIHIAAYEGDRAKLNELITSGADLEVRANAHYREWFGVTPVHAAAEADATDCIDALLAAGAGLDAPDGIGRSPLWAAAERCSERAVEYLLVAGANPQGVAGEDEWADCYTPFQLALAQCSTDLVTEFLTHGTIRDLAGKAAFAYVGDPDRLAKIELLLPIGLGVDAVDDPIQRTCLANAAIDGDIESIHLLVEHGADLDLPSGSDALTPVFWAAYCGETKAMTELLDLGADPYTGTPYYGSLIYAASFNGHTAAVRELLNRGLDIPLDLGRASDGSTPLHMAYWNENQELIQLLLEAGAAPELRTTDGRRPRDYGR